MHQIRVNRAYGTGQCRHLKPTVRLCSKTDDLRAAGLDGIRIRTQAANRTYDVLEAVVVQSRDQIDESVLQATLPKTVYHVHNADRLRHFTDPLPSIGRQHS